MTPAVRSRGAVVVLGLLLATVLAACASDDPAPRSPPRLRPPDPPSRRRAPPPDRPAPNPPEPVERSGFHGKIDELPAGLAAEMRGTTWHPGCPVPLDGLRLLHFNYWGFGGNVLRGPMVVNASVAEDVLWVFHRLYDARFPIKRVSLSTPFHPKAFAQHRRIDSNRSVTASFNCRPVVTALGPEWRLLAARLRARGRCQPAAEPLRHQRRLRPQPGGRAVHRPEPRPRGHDPRGGRGVPFVRGDRLGVGRELERRQGLHALLTNRLLTTTGDHVGALRPTSSGASFEQERG